MQKMKKHLVMKNLLINVCLPLYLLLDEKIISLLPTLKYYLDTYILFHKILVPEN